MRLKSLDGLRGLCALIVVFYHSLLLISYFSDRDGALVQPYGHDTWLNHIYYSPVHFIFAGPEAVTIFFVLSGYVLIFAIQKEHYLKFLRNRFLRLYIPIFGSVFIASIFLFMIPRKPLSNSSSWLTVHIIRPTFGNFLRNAWLFDGNNALNFSLWSMRYEVFFSMFVLVFAGVKFKAKSRNFVLIIFLVFLTLFIGISLRADFLSYLPIFLAGSALHLLPVKINYVNSRFLLGCFLITAPFTLAGLGIVSTIFFQKAVTLLGAILIVDASRIESLMLRKVFCSKPLQALGKRSFSVYLIHDPVIVSIWFLFGYPKGLFVWILQYFLSLFFTNDYCPYHRAQKQNTTNFKWDYIIAK